jgi:hypothetical protein
VNENRENSRDAAPVPLTRDLREIVRAFEIVEAEFRFQAHRLERTVTADTENEEGHLADLRRGYGQGAKYAGILLNYHKGRLTRMGQRGFERVEPIEDTSDDVSAEGRARPFTTDTE